MADDSDIEIIPYEKPTPPLVDLVSDTEADVLVKRKSKKLKVSKQSLEKSKDSKKAKCKSKKKTKKRSYHDANKLTKSLFESPPCNGGAETIDGSSRISIVTDRDSSPDSLGCQAKSGSSVNAELINSSVNASSGEFADVGQFDVSQHDEQRNDSVNVEQIDRVLSSKSNEIIPNNQLCHKVAQLSECNNKLSSMNDSSEVANSTTSGTDLHSPKKKKLKKDKRQKLRTNRSQENIIDNVETLISSPVQLGDVVQVHPRTRAEIDNFVRTCLNVDPSISVTLENPIKKRKKTSYLTLENSHVCQTIEEVIKTGLSLNHCSKNYDEESNVPSENRMQEIAVTSVKEGNLHSFHIENTPDNTNHSSTLEVSSNNILQVENPSTPRDSLSKEKNSFNVKESSFENHEDTAGILCSRTNKASVGSEVGFLAEPEPDMHKSDSVEKDVRDRRFPSKWNPEMIRFYGKTSEEAANMDVKKILKGLPGNKKFWPVAADQPRVQYREKTRCYKCLHYGHPSSFCTEPEKAVVCYCCGGIGHKLSISGHFCPQALCLRCGKRSNDFKYDCSSCRSSEAKTCRTCGGWGHVAKVCPDLWRKYHAVRNIEDVAEARKMKVRYRDAEKRYCSLCGSKGHGYFQCRRKNRKFYLNSPFIVGIPDESLFYQTGSRKKIPESTIPGRDKSVVLNSTCSKKIPNVRKTLDDVCARPLSKEGIHQSDSEIEKNTGQANTYHPTLNEKANSGTASDDLETISDASESELVPNAQPSNSCVGTNGIEEVSEECNVVFLGLAERSKTVTDIKTMSNDALPQSGCHKGSIGLETFCVEQASPKSISVPPISDKLETVITEAKSNTCNSNGFSETEYVDSILDKTTNEAFRKEPCKLKPLDEVVSIGGFFVSRYISHSKLERKRETVAGFSVSEFPSSHTNGNFQASESEANVSVTADNQSIRSADLPTVPMQSSTFNNQSNTLAKQNKIHDPINEGNSLSRPQEGQSSKKVEVVVVISSDSDSDKEVGKIQLKDCRKTDGSVSNRLVLLLCNQLFDWLHQSNHKASKFLSILSTTFNISVTTEKTPSPRCFISDGKHIDRLAAEHNVMELQKLLKKGGGGANINLNEFPKFPDWYRDRRRGTGEDAQAKGRKKTERNIYRRKPANDSGTSRSRNRSEIKIEHARSSISSRPTSEHRSTSYRPPNDNYMHNVNSSSNLGSNSYNGFHPMPYVWEFPPTNHYQQQPMNRMNPMLYSIPDDRNRRYQTTQAHYDGQHEMSFMRHEQPQNNFYFDHRWNHDPPGYSGYY